MSGHALRVLLCLFLMASGSLASGDLPADEAVLLPGGRGEVSFGLLSPQATLADPRIESLEGDDRPTVLPGEPVEWTILVTVNGDSLGLAMVSVDLLQDPGNPILFDLPPGLSAPQAMGGFDRPGGYANPGPERGSSAYGGRPTAAAHGRADLLQIGGAQNTFGVVGPCFGEAGDVCVGRDVEVEQGVGQTPPGQVIATGIFPAPDLPGEYRFTLGRPRANVLTAVGVPPDPATVRPARVALAAASIRILVADPSSPDAPAGSARVYEPVPLSRVGLGEEPVRPRDGAALNYTHVGFWWPAFSPPSAEYTLMIAEDDGSADPFLQDPPGLIVHVTDGGEPRLVVTEGLEFGKSYAWRVLGKPASGSGLRVGPVYRFSTVDLPSWFPETTVTHPESGALGGGVTLTDLWNPSLDLLETDVVVGVDEKGEYVFFLQRPENPTVVNALRIEMATDGTLMLRRFAGPPGNRRSIMTLATLDGRVLWEMPQDRGYRNHHDFDLTPDGDPLLLLDDPLPFPGVADPVRADKLVLLDRQTRDELWVWRVEDHYSKLDVFLPLRRGWTHGNAVVYHEAHESVYFSARFLDRISRIAFPTGEIRYNMGSDAPSGDVHFGDGLFTRQHAPEILDDGNMLLFDNASASQPRHSRVVELAFDDPLAPSSAEIAWSWKVPGRDGNPTHIELAGQASRLPGGNTLVTGSTQGILYEVTRDGRLVWQLDFEAGDSVLRNYRSQRVASLVVDTPGDRDGDWDLDLLDLGDLQASFGLGGTEELPFPDYLSDMNGDGGIEPEDLEEFARRMSGPGR